MEDSILKDIGAYKNKVISSFINSDDICALLLNKTNYSENDKENLVYSQIFPYLYADDTQTDILSYLCVETDILRISTNTVKDMKLIIWVYCHKNIMKYSKKGYMGTRADILADMSERVLRNSNKFGIGRLQLQSVGYFFPNNKYYGKQLIYLMPDFKIK